jgi:hypothetical protein
MPLELAEVAGLAVETLPQHNMIQMTCTRELVDVRYELRLR